MVKSTIFIIPRSTNGSIRGSIRYARFVLIPVPGQNVRLAIPPNQRNTGPGAILMPAGIGEVFPFHYAEIESHDDLEAWQIAVHMPFDGDLCAKTLIDLAREDGLISTEQAPREIQEKVHLFHDRYIYEHGIRDLVDWPPGSFTAGGIGEQTR
jgi:hypothetical protein